MQKIWTRCEVFILYHGNEQIQKERCRQVTVKNFTDKVPAQPALIYSVLIRDWIREPSEVIHKILT